MNRNRRITTVCILAGICLCPALAQADEAADAFNSLFGEDYKKALASRETDDDLALAKKLYAAALTSKNQPAFQAVLCEKIWELACRDGGGAQLVLDSARLLERSAPQKREELSEKYLDAVQKCYAVSKPPRRNDVGEALIEALESQADARKSDPNSAELLRRALGVAAAINSLSKEELQSRLQAHTIRQRAIAQAEMLEAGLRAAPTDKATREKLIYLRLVELDDPAAAAKALDESVEESLRTYVPLAAGKLDALADEACMELAGWYDGLSKRNLAARVAMLVRERNLFEQYLRKHAADDLNRKKAEIKLREVKETLAKLSPSLGVSKPTFKDRELEDAFDKAVRYLWAAQREDGSWKEHPGQAGGSTALIALSLLEGGTSARDSRMGKALKWLSAVKTDRTYVLSLRANCFALAARSMPGSFAEEVRRDVELLATSTSTGGYDYGCKGDGKDKNRDNSNSQFGVLGVSAGAGTKLTIPSKYWETVLQFWTGRQNSDGGWGYHKDGSKPTMAAAGLTSTILCQLQLGKTREAILEIQGVKDAIAYLEKNHQGMIDNRDPQAEFHYYLYAVARAGTGIGSTSFGKVDWFKTGAPVLKKSQREDGSWDGKYGPEVSTALSALFLAKGAALQAAP